MKAKLPESRRCDAVPDPDHPKDLGTSKKNQQNSGPEIGLFDLGLEATTADYIEQSGRSVTLYFTNASRAELFRAEWLKCCAAVPLTTEETR